MLVDRSEIDMYNLEKKEFKEFEKKFRKTYCGRWLNRFSLLPGFAAVVSILLMIISSLDSYLEPTFCCSSITNTFSEFDGTLYFICLVISGSIFAVTQLIYFNMLDKYISRSSK